MMRKSIPGSEFNDRLKAYFGTLGASSIADALKRSAEKWPVYATAAGAALAMASNASASIIYSGDLDLTVSIPKASGVFTSAKSFFLPISSRARIVAYQETKFWTQYHVRVGVAGLFGSRHTCMF
ncbi:MAG TPA: hypothetical protein VHY84_03265 [Bryobacteraceae bacterium]|jgi:hypothetical protein|nr:hypothetical protein [Bryobacteraceae bacterium]